MQKQKHLDVLEGKYSGYYYCTFENDSKIRYSNGNDRYINFIKDNDYFPQVGIIQIDEEGKRVFESTFEIYPEGIKPLKYRKKVPIYSGDIINLSTIELYEYGPRTK
jgi:hypothetical protein